MAMTAAERQAKCRARKKAMGLRRQDQWIVQGGGLAKVTDDGRWPQMTKADLDGVIRRAVRVFVDDDMYKECVYAEIAAYVDMAVSRFMKYRDSVNV
jgi:hypothetical protein